jgi:hypothetical protein
VPAVESGSEKLPSTMSLDSSRRPLSQEEAHDGCFLKYCRQQYLFFLFSFLSSPLKYNLTI